jgi:flagellar biosynthesis protein
MSQYSGERPVDRKPQVKTAVALGYDPAKDVAPRVIASGQGEIADKIIEIARQNQIPVRDDDILAQALSQVELDQVIPPELYTVVAEVLAFVYRLRKKKLENK